MSTIWDDSNPRRSPGEARSYVAGRQRQGAVGGPGDVAQEERQPGAKLKLSTHPYALDTLL